MNVIKDSHEYSHMFTQVVDSGVADHLVSQGALMSALSSGFPF